MKLSRVPDLLIGKRLVAPLVRGMEQLAEIRSDADGLRHNSGLLKGGIVLAVAAVEYAVVDALRYYLIARPWALGENELKVDPRDISHAVQPRDLLHQAVEQKLRNLRYQSVRKQLGTVVSKVGLQAPDGGIVDAFVELNETRNLIVHSDMRAKEEYLERSGERRRVEREGEIVPITDAYLLSSLVVCHGLLDALRSSAEHEYANFSRAAAIGRLWAWMFRSPVMQFEHFWAVDEDEEEVAYLDPPIEHLSSGEQIMLSLWLRQVTARGPREPFTLYSLDRMNRRKVSYLLSLLEDFSIR